MRKIHQSSVLQPILFKHYVIFPPNHVRSSLYILADYNNKYNKTNSPNNKTELQQDLQTKGYGQAKFYFVVNTKNESDCHLFYNTEQNLGIQTTIFAKKNLSNVKNEQNFGVY